MAVATFYSWFAALVVVCIPAFAASVLTDDLYSTAEFAGM